MRRWILTGGALVVLCLCVTLALAGAGAAFIYYLRPATVVAPPVAPPLVVSLVAATPTRPPAGQTTPTQPPVGRTPPPATGEAPPTGEATPAADPATLAMLDQIEQEVIGLRGLQPAGAFDLRFPTPDEYRQVTVDNFEKDYSHEEAVNDGRVLAAIGLLPPGADVYNLYLDLYSEQVLGSYDPETKKMYVITASGKIGGVERQTYAHEYDHALQDENYDIQALGRSDDACDKDSERCAAISALTEGDSTLLETQWLQKFGTTQDYADLAEFYGTFTSPAYDRTPCYLRDDFYWPYDDGLKFVKGLYDQGGWAAVDEAYRNPPVSTEQILHPNLYRAGDIPEAIPAPVLTDTLGAGWQQIDAGVMGEWYTRLILLEPFRNSDRTGQDYCRVTGRNANRMADAAAGWGGDGYVVSYDESTSQTVLALLTTWDSDGDASQFADAFKSYSDRRFGTSAQQHGSGSCWDAKSSGVSCFFRRGSDTLWAMAPDEATLDRIVALIPPFAGG